MKKSMSLVFLVTLCAVLAVGLSGCPLKQILVTKAGATYAIWLDQVGDDVPLTLVFEKDGACTLTDSERDAQLKQEEEEDAVKSLTGTFMEYPDGVVMCSFEDTDEELLDTYYDTYNDDNGTPDDVEDDKEMIIVWTPDHVLHEMYLWELINDQLPAETFVDGEYVTSLVFLADDATVREMTEAELDGVDEDWIPEDFGGADFEEEDVYRTSAPTPLEAYRIPEAEETEPAAEGEGEEEGEEEEA
jgi:hypothetical protein